MRGSSRLADEGFEPRAALGEGQVAQVFVALGEEVVDAQMGREIGDQLRRHGLAVEALLKDVEALHAAVAHDQQFAVDARPRSRAPRRDRGRRARRPRRCANRCAATERPSPARPATACRRMPSHFHSAKKSAGVELFEILLLDRMRQHRRPERRRVAGFGLRPAPSTQANSVLVGRLEAVPDQLDLVRRRSRRAARPRSWRAAPRRRPAIRG